MRATLPLKVCVAILALSVIGYLATETILKRVRVHNALVVEANRLLAELKSFQQEASKLPVDQASERWLALYDAFVMLPPEVVYVKIGGHQLSMESVLMALPPVAAWDDLANRIERRAGEGHTLRDDGLRLLAGILMGDGKARRHSLEALRVTVKADKKLEHYQRQRYEISIEQVSLALDKISDSSTERLAAFERLLAMHEVKDRAADEGVGDSIVVPDLVKDLGEAKAEPLLLRVLRTGADFQIEGKQTRSLMARLALNHLRLLKKPAWSLITGEEDISLYEAMVKKFPTAESGDERLKVDTFFLLNLIAKERTQEAVKFVRERTVKYPDYPFSPSRNEIEGMNARGFGDEMLAFLTQMLGSDPAIPLWDTYVKLAARQGSSAAAVALLRETLKKNLSKKVRRKVSFHYCEALLAANETVEGVEMLREVMKTLDSLSKERTEELDVESQQFELAVKLASLGRLLEKPDLQKEGLAMAKEAYAKLPSTQGTRQYLTEKLVMTLLESGLRAEAEELVAKELVIIAKAGPRGDDTSTMLGALAYIFDQANRPEDVVRLLNDSAQWPGEDLADLASVSFGESPMLLLAAKALAATGKKDIAQKAVRRAVQRYPGNDSAYALLLSLGGDDVEAVLDQAQAVDRFEERPLIWKGQLKLQQGKLDEAEKYLRAAITIDPSDGEQGKGDRMRAYAVLVEVLEKKGDAEQAKVLRGAVEAIRLSESADDWWEAGLLSEAVNKYEDALLHFANAYCVQSRLALRYSEMGDYAKAEQHYRRAFELMPESFGRVESHCFGCEGAFSGQRAQNIADKVFTQLANQMPDRAQVFYLLGYLRQQQDRNEEATELFRKAVKIDPDYLNAWKKWMDLRENVTILQADRDHAALEIFRLDPLGRKVGNRLNEVTDLRKLWTAILTAEPALPKLDEGPLYPLAASKAALDQFPEGRQHYQTRHFFTERLDLRQQFLKNNLVTATSSLLQIVNRKE